MANLRAAGESRPGPHAGLDRPQGLDERAARARHSARWSARPQLALGRHAGIIFRFRKASPVHVMRLRYVLLLLCAVARLPHRFYVNGKPTIEPAEWPVYGGGPESIRYSSLTQINRDNVTHLKVAWTFDAGDGVGG